MNIGVFFQVSAVADPVAPVVQSMPAAVPAKGLIDYLFGSGLVVQLVLIILIVLSVLSWAVIIAKLIQIRKAKKENLEFSGLFWETRNLSRIDDTSRRLNTCPLVKLFVTGYRELIQLFKDQQADAYSKGDLSTIDSVMSRAELEEGSRLERGITFLATTASAAPFIGLFGTVWGIMNAFQGLAYAKSTTIQAVAPGISEALVATAVGLAAAIPASVGYNFFSAAINQIKDSMDNFRGEFLTLAKKEIAEGSKGV